MRFAMLGVLLALAGCGGTDELGLPSGPNRCVEEAFCQCDLLDAKTYEHVMTRYFALSYCTEGRKDGIAASLACEKIELQYGYRCWCGCDGI